MNKLMLIAGALLLVASNNSFAKAEVEITWENPKKFKEERKRPKFTRSF